MAQWKPNATVAAVVEHDGRFLLVEEHTPDGPQFNQPAGHWELGETLLDAVVRETREETGFLVEPVHLVGIYAAPRRDVPSIVYLRFAFACRLVGEVPDAELDEGIIGPRWMTLEEIHASGSRHRSSLVVRCAEDARAGRHYPLELLTHVGFGPHAA
ncbi:NUDIX hydrolase [Laribacter hongkongensis]|uniref:Phosphatase NudJ n=1 Tax=Laribacter hongkongensis TaxID=168471 RepID=A0ABD4SRZ4_9NEIS|nr:NUDIX hydrolase [Laribacter hongkongensis]MCG9025321.1 NUDIX hydrolase [Laribacter hongkongensis]MCG9099811.1 NUDIX hydrolase [Laribacter hongkongensis]MCG9103387.1 NUDIX hydrolase [Laribacter hongkongensis]MCG9111289.1 NUDIX hydrolase [Laribacter hongkongensis]MCG9118555.1 NUDIX hydrolase [Laribacter hongkongensis]